MDARLIFNETTGRFEAVGPNGQTLALVTGLEVVETLQAAKTLKVSDSGKAYMLALAGGFTVSLPAVSTAAGCHYKFFVKIAPTTAYIVQTNASEEKLAGQVYASSGGDEDSETDITATNVNFVANTAVIGDSCEIWSDGVGWYVRAFCNAAGGITITG